MKRYCIFVPALLAAACAPLPPEPPASTPRQDVAADQAVQALRQASTSGAAAGSNMAAEVSEAEWWREFKDEQLNRLVAEALQHSPDLQVVQARLTQAQQAEQLVRLDGQVHYDANASVIRQRYSEHGIFPPPIGGSVVTDNTVSLGLSYSLDWWGKQRAEVQAAIGSSRAAAAELRAARLNLAAAVTEAWFSWGNTRAQLQLAQQMQQKRQQQVQWLEWRWQHGLDSQLPLHEARQRLQQQNDALQALAYQEKAAQYRVAALLGRSPDKAAGLPQPVMPAAVAPLPTELPADWLAHRPDVEARRWQVEAAGADVTAMKAAFYPNIDLKLLLGLESIDASQWLSWGSRMGQVGPAIHLPLFNVQTLQARLGQSQTRYRTAVAAYDSTLLEAARQAADSYALNLAQDQRAAAQQAAQQEAEQTLWLTMQRRAAGLASQLQVLDSDIAALAQQQRTNESNTARLRARVALQQALGGYVIRSKQ